MLFRRFGKKGKIYFYYNMVNNTYGNRYIDIYIIVVEKSSLFPSYIYKRWKINIKKWEK